MKRFIPLALSFFAVNLAGCSLLTPDWVHPEGRTLSQFNADAGNCQYQWSLLTPASDTPYIINEGQPGTLGAFMQYTSIDPHFEAECLESKGWVRKQ